MNGVEIRRLGSGEVELILAASALFDEPAIDEWASLFLNRQGHHLLIAYLDENPVGFISGVETTHPDKGTEMFVYELAVTEAHRRHGIGQALVAALTDIAREKGCYGMWVGTEPGNIAAISTYRSAGADAPEPFLTLSWTFAGTEQ